MRAAEVRAAGGHAHRCRGLTWAPVRVMPRPYGLADNSAVTEQRGRRRIAADPITASDATRTARATLGASEITRTETAQSGESRGCAMAVAKASSSPGPHGGRFYMVDRTTRRRQERVGARSPAEASLNQPGSFGRIARAMRSSSARSLVASPEMTVTSAPSLPLTNTRPCGPPG
jgi:hypothetical protein